MKGLIKMVNMGHCHLAKVGKFEWDINKVVREAEKRYLTVNRFLIFWLRLEQIDSLDRDLMFPLYFLRCHNNRVKSWQHRRVLQQQFVT